MPKLNLQGNPRLPLRHELRQKEARLRRNSRPRQSSSREDGEEEEVYGSGVLRRDEEGERLAGAGSGCGLLDFGGDGGGGE